MASLRVRLCRRRRQEKIKFVRGNYNDMASPGDVHCHRCNLEMYEESGMAMRCELCEEYYCQECFWEVLPEEYKRTHQVVVTEDEYDDAACDWCCWDVSWEDRDIATLIKQRTDKTF